MGKYVKREKCLKKAKRCIKIGRRKIWQIGDCVT